MFVYGRFEQLPFLFWTANTQFGQICPKLIHTCWIRWWYFSVLHRKHLFLANFALENKIVYQHWNLIVYLILISNMANSIMLLTLPVLIRNTLFLANLVHKVKIACLNRPLTFQKNGFICFNESTLKMMKKAFYFISKTLFVLKIFKFLSWIFGDAEETAAA